MNRNTAGVMKGGKMNKVSNIIEIGSPKGLKASTNTHNTGIKNHINIRSSSNGLLQVSIPVSSALSNPIENTSDNTGTRSIISHSNPLYLHGKYQTSNANHQQQYQQFNDLELDELNSMRGSAQSNSSSLSSNISTAILKYKLLENLELDLDYLDDHNTIEKSRFGKWKGKHTFICKGLVMLGPSNDHLMVTIALIFGVWTAHLILVGPFVGEKNYYFFSIALCFINLITLLITASTDPGIIPRRDSKRVLVDNNVELFLDMNHSQYSYCKICKIIKPTRTKHCRLCNCCIQGFDHHCPWIGTCIGIRNYIFFIIFLIFMLISIFFCLGSSIVLCCGIYQKIECNRPFIRIVALVVMLPTLLLLLIFIGSLLFFHIFLSIKGISTSEFIRGTERQNEESAEKRKCISILLDVFAKRICNQNSFRTGTNSSLSLTSSNKSAVPSKSFLMSCSKNQLKQFKKLRSSTHKKSVMETCCLKFIENNGDDMSNFDLEKFNETFSVNVDQDREKVLQNKNGNCCEITSDIGDTLCMGGNWTACFLTRKPSLLLPMHDSENELDLLLDIDLSIYLLDELGEKFSLNNIQ